MATHPVPPGASPAKPPRVPPAANSLAASAGRQANVDALLNFKIASATPFGPTAEDLRNQARDQAASLLKLVEVALADAGEDNSTTTLLHNDHMINVIAGIGTLLNLSMYASEGVL